jgi:pentose-5-phosphate-3-epimerase
MVYSGDLGRHGGQADLALLGKVPVIREYYPDIEISWDGGINDQNARALVEAGIDVLNVGGFIQNAAQPQDAYQKLLGVVD